MRAKLLVPAGMLCLLGVYVVSQFDGSDSPALAASKKVTDAVTVIKSDVAWNMKLMAFEKLRKEGGAQAISALMSLASHKDDRVKALACTTLGRMKTDESKQALKTIITNTSKPLLLRRAATNALAGSGTLADRSWIESKLSSDPALKDHLSKLKSAKFWKY